MKPYLFNIIQTSCLLIVLLTSTAYAVDNTKGLVKSSTQQWFQYYTKTKVSQNLNVLADGGIRFKDNLNQKTQYLVRVALQRKVNDKLFLAGGFANLGFYKSEKINQYELRPYQELVVIFNKNQLSWNNRFRIEEQMYYNNKFVYKDLNLRFRYQISFSIPLIRFYDKKNILFLNIGDELFLNLNKENILNQNRILLGSTLKFSNKTSIFFTYNYQLKPDKTNDYYYQDDVFWVGIKQNLDFSKK